MYNKTRIIKKHSAKCDYKGEREAYCFDKVDWRRMVLLFGCNNPDCKFLMEIGMKRIDRILKKELRKLKTR